MIISRVIYGFKILTIYYIPSIKEIDPYHLEIQHPDFTTYEIIKEAGSCFYVFMVEPNSDEESISCYLCSGERYESNSHEFHAINGTEKKVLDIFIDGDITTWEEMQEACKDYWEDYRAWRDAGLT